MNEIKKSRKSTLFLILFIILVLIYLAASFYFLRPDILTWWSDEYEYLSQAINFSDFSKLETSFYTGKAVLYGDFPSFGYHPILFSFILGLFLKIIFGLKTLAFIFNYILFLGIFIVFYFLSRSRMDRASFTLFLFSALFFPLVIIYANTLAPEIFLVFLATIIFYLFFKNENKFNILHFLLLILISLVAVQKFTFLILAITLLVYTYYIWARQKKAVYIISSLIFFAGLYFILYMTLANNIQLYPAVHENSIYFYLKTNGFGALLTTDTWKAFYGFFIENLKGYLRILIDLDSVYFLLHWLIIAVVIFNIVIFFRSRDIKNKKELGLILIPEILIILASVVAYPPTDLEHFSHLRPFLAFIPINIFYIYIFYSRLKNRSKILIPILLIPIIFFSSYQIIRPYQLDKKQTESEEKVENTELISGALSELRFKDSMVIGGIDDVEIREALIQNEYNDYFIRLNQFPLSKQETDELIEKVKFDLWIVKNDSLHIINHLDTWPFRYSYSNRFTSWEIFIDESAYPLEEHYVGDRDMFKYEWEPLNNCEFIVENGFLVLNAFGEDPYFENHIDLDFSLDKNYYLEIIIDCPEESYIQLFFRNTDTGYSEENSIKRLTDKGENRFVLKLGGETLRVDPGTGNGKYVIKKFNILVSDY